MAKQRPGRPLEGKVNVVGVRPRVSLTDRDGAVADLSITLTGGSGRAPVPVTFSVGLNVPLSGRARLIDDATQRVVAESTRSGSAHVFRNVPVVSPGSGRTRRFRITNVRANAAGLAASQRLIPTQILAFVSVSAPFRIPLSGAQQNVAAMRR
jgi:hypothetical protein